MADLESNVRGPSDELERETERIVTETMAVIQEKKKAVREMMQAETDWFWEGGGQKQGS